MIYISGFLLLELSSVLISRAFFERLPMSLVLNAAKKGYRIKPYREEDFSFLLNEYEEQLIKIKSMKNLAMLIPGYNIVKSYSKVKSIQEDIIDEAQSKDILYEITDAERREYNTLTNHDDKYLWTLSFKQEELEIKDIPKKNIMDKGINYQTLFYPKLKDKYSVEDVETLNSLTGYGYKLGTIEGIPTAIIGIYDCDMKFDMVNIKEEGKEYHEFKPVSKKEAEATNMQFDVYSYINIDSMAFSEEMEKIHFLNKIQNLELSDTILEKTENTVVEENQEDSKEKNKVLTLSFK